MNRFVGKRILVTGAASGIGRATALRLASEDGLVFAVDRDAKRLKDLIHNRITTHTADIAHEQEVLHAVHTAYEVLGGLDALINVAGIHRITPLPDLTPTAFHDLLAINCVGTALMCREAMPHLMTSRGVVVNVASTAATHGHPYMTAYAASKGALLAFSLSLAAEVAPHRVRVVAVSPGGVRTPMVTAMEVPEGADIDPTFFSRTRPLTGYGEPEQIAATIAYAASSDGSYLTGVELRVDGGSHV
ncbi:SDR family NAD(P)-dependent oxidoreductase [Nonomuraea sp. NPDC049400]|uniref:SDR family NAD(P)-dependent oxidoreductase n=1 Tax=Nonomuraea sp. NPDC049400 TaxID=3364352 RepID=UPI00378CB852